jgi:hypothetical protein
MSLILGKVDEHLVTFAVVTVKQQIADTLTILLRRSNFEFLE